ncbi:MAG: HAMP domain-containing protein [Planctomycetes bacterium]|nr:HAMP domain-containing protein [Planctomycetota bacterium]
MRLSIRWRLALWNTFALACVLSLLGGLVFWLFRQTHERIDRALQERAEHALLNLDQSLLQQFQQLKNDPQVQTDMPKRLAHWIYEFKEHDSFFCVVYDQTGRAILKTEEMPSQSAPEPPREDLTAPQYQEVSIPVLGRQRVLQGRLHAGSENYAIVLLASLAEIDRVRLEVQNERAEVDREFRAVASFVAASIPVAILFVGGVGYLLARKALAPVDRLNRLAEGINAKRLDRRLPVLHPDDELGRLTTTINAMIARLERSFAEIRRFTGDASHELRTPLTAIRAEAEIALAKPMTPAEHNHLLGSILEECDRLTRLTDQLLNLSREDSNGFTQVRDLLDLSALVKQVTETMTPLMESKGLHLECACRLALPIRGDESRLRQVFINLLDNAIKYTPRDGRITVESCRDGNNALVRIRDNGIGIASEHQERVFERFYRVDKARGRAEGGAGLGLSIARSIIQSHGGAITLSSEQGAGTTVVVQLALNELSPALGSAGRS